MMSKLRTEFYLLFLIHYVIQATLEKSECTFKIYIKDTKHIELYIKFYRLEPTFDNLYKEQFIS